MTNEKKPEAPKAPAKDVTINPNKKKDDSELDDDKLKDVSGGRASRAGACTCSNMPSDPG